MAGKKPNPTPSTKHQDERRDVTILFADVKGFTSMCERLDPEQVREIMNDCFEGLGRAVQEQGGYVDKYIGDCIMAVFGAPVAHEDDPARACRAALTMQSFLPKFAKRYESMAGVLLQMRIGINCGLVVSGGVGSEEIKQDYTVMGDTVNLASRMETSATPGHILVSDPVFKRTKGQFKFGPVQKLKVKGKKEEVEGYDLLGEIEGEAGRRRDELSVALMGRQEEHKKLFSRIQDTERQRDWIEVRGEIGMGKNRLIEEVLNQFPDKKQLSVTATPLLQQRTFGFLQRLIHVVVNELAGQALPPETYEEFKEGFQSLGPELDLFLPALWYIAAPARLRIPPPDPDPKTLRRMVEEGMIILLKNFSQKNKSHLFLLDAYEWIDKESATLLERLGKLVDGWPCTFIVAARQEARPPLQPSEVITLQPLSLNESEQLLDSLVRKAELFQGLKKDILRRAEGIPLYLEEIVRTLLDRGILKKKEGVQDWEFDATQLTKDLILPVSVRAAMTSRLDQLQAAEKVFLGQCSVQGLDYDLKVVETIRLNPKRKGPPIYSLIPRLERQNFIAKSEEVLMSRMIFCHPLMQETAYETLMEKERQALHYETAIALCNLGGGAELVPPDLLAYHFRKAKQWREAARADLRCGHRASELFLNEEAINRYDQAIQAISLFTNPTDVDKKICAEAFSRKGLVYLRMGQYPSVKQCVKEMEPFALDPSDQAEARRLLAEANYHTGKIKESRSLLQEAVELSRREDLAIEVIMAALLSRANLFVHENEPKEALKDLKDCRIFAGADFPLNLIRINTLEGIVVHAAGEFDKAVDFYSRAFEEAEKTGTLSERAKASNNLGNVERDRGNYHKAKQHYERALEFWEKMGDMQCIAGAHNNLGNVGMSIGDYKMAREHQEKSLQACREIGNTYGMALALTNIAILCNEEKRGREAVQLAQEALKILGDSGGWLKALTLVACGEGYLSEEHLEEAKVVFEKVLRADPKETHPLAIATALRGLGRIDLMSHCAEEAIALLEKSAKEFLKLKRVQEAARTSVFLAQALREKGENESASSTLEEALHQFLRMNCKQDIAKAEQLLKTWRQH